MPWALFVLIAGKEHRRVRRCSGSKRFADTGNPGYFIIKLALWLMALLILAQAAVDILRPRRG